MTAQAYSDHGRTIAEGAGDRSDQQHRQARQRDVDRFFPVKGREVRRHDHRRGQGVHLLWMAAEIRVILAISEIGIDSF